MAEFDVAVVGAGAAGLLAATRAAERGLRTTLLEKTPRPGVKILMSGGTRCNLTHHTDRRGIIRAYGDQGRFLHSPLASLGPAELVALVEAEGIATKVEETGKVFPVSNKAADILRAFTRRLERSGCHLQLGRGVVGLQPGPDGWHLDTTAGPLTCRGVIIATGGKSYPGCGTTGDAYAWLQSLGHTIVTPRPALVPLTSSESWLPELAGITLPDVAVAVVGALPAGSAATGVPVPTDTRPPVDRGSFLFTHRGISGPAVLNVSRGLTQLADPATAQLQCNFLPHLAPPELDQLLRDRATAQGRKALLGILSDLLPQRVLQVLLSRAGIPPERRCADLSKDQRLTLTRTLQQCRLPLTGSLGYAKAEVTAGGVALAEVDSKTMSSRRHPGLFLAGEVLDLDGPIGGFNFQAAFSTGWLAGERILA
ncbi:MAG TPA: aminoacetone oxidase family FAD-binding enzyme [Planctomycetaceae bacterium]|nr:aminoacetone oxidase family FAD-binding enzyme [Planctomycetaceae bacterium]